MTVQRWVFPVVLSLAFGAMISGAAAQSTTRTVVSETIPAGEYISTGSLDAQPAAPTGAVDTQPAPVYTVTTQNNATAGGPILAAVRANSPSEAPSLAALRQSGQAPDGDFGYMLIDAGTGQVLSEHNADTPFPPSSMGKLLATVAIMEAMGPDGRFRTSVLADGPIKGGVLKGNLHLVGSGDPSFLSSDLRRLAQRVADTGLRSVTGSFFFHGGAIPETSTIDRGQPSAAVYNPGLSGLNVDHNERNAVAPIKNPARYTAKAFKRYAAAAGVSLPAPKRASSRAQGQEIAVHESQPVTAILTEMFDISRNMTAEALGAAAAAKLSRKPSSLADAAQITTDWIKGQIGPIGGAGWAGFHMPNHSGLSTRARATVRQMAAIQLHGYQRFGPTYKHVHEMQTSGNSQGVDYAIQTKFGTMSYSRAIAGILSLNERDYIFAIMSTDPARRMRNAEAWNDKGRKLEQALFSSWLKDYWPVR